jgi:hypothetical protein
MPVNADIDETTAILMRARSFIESGWCRFTNAVDEAGNAVLPTSERAVAWCAWGALIAAKVPRLDYGAHPAICRLEDALDDYDITHFNDIQETVETVLAAFDRAIACTDRPIGRTGRWE